MFPLLDVANQMPRLMLQCPCHKLTVADFDPEIIIWTYEIDRPRFETVSLALGLGDHSFLQVNFAGSSKALL